jgi:superfamily II DNA or RNA helicase
MVSVTRGELAATPSPGAARQPGAGAPVPHLRLRTERLAVDRSNGFESAVEEVEAAVMQLDFGYGGRDIRASDGRTTLLFDEPGGCRVIDRDLAAEAQARHLLESFGAVDLSCLDEWAAAPGSAADYLVNVDGDVHAICSFSAYALPQLRALGWRVSVAADYPWQVLTGELPWYARVAGEERSEDWFSLELGVELDGDRVNLLPALLEFLHSRSGATSLAALTRTCTRYVAVPVGDRRYLALEPARMQTLLQVLLELYGGERAIRPALEFPAAQAASLANLEAAFPGTGKGLRWEGAREVLARGRAIARGPAPAAAEEQPHGLCATLRSYQQEGVRWMGHLRANAAGGILADDMGLGKTLQTIAHLLGEKDAGRMDLPSLIVAPTSLVGNWQREIARFAPRLRVAVLQGAERHARWNELSRHHVAITSFPLLLRDASRVTAQSFHYLVVDEAQTIKNSRSQAHRLIKQIDARHRLCLTGTPVENSLDELWALFDVVMPGLLGDQNRFRTQFRQPIEQEGREVAAAALRQRVAPYILRRLKENVASELPPKTELWRPVEITGAQRELYESIRVAAHARVRSVIRKLGFAASTIAILDALMKLRQVCCDPRLLRVDSARSVSESAKYDVLFELLDKQLAQGRRILVFSQFTSMLSLIAQGLRERDVCCAVLTGDTRDRQAQVDAFQSGAADVFLISLKAGGTGLNLTRADTVIHYDPWWNPAAQAQATDRAYRIGQTRPVFVYKLVVAGSVEERMLWLQRRKQKLAESILGSAPGGIPFGEPDLDGFFAPLSCPE